MTNSTLDRAVATVAALAADLSRQGFTTEAMSAQRCARDLREAALRHRATAALTSIYASEMPTDRQRLRHDPAA